MLNTKLYLVALLILISNNVHATEVITPGYILLNITKNYQTIDKLQKHWAISGSEFESNKKNRKEYLLKLNFLKNIDPKSIILGTRNHEKITQVVQTKNGIKLTVTFKFTKHEFNKKTELNFEGDYSLVSISRFQPIHVVKSIFEYPYFTTTGYVVLKYACPKCPAGATCKPCMRNNIIISEKPDLLESYSFVGENELVVFYENTEKLVLRGKYTFRIKSVNNELQLISYQIMK